MKVETQKNLSLAMIWQIIYTHKLPKLCSATLSSANLIAVLATNVIYAYLKNM